MPHIPDHLTHDPELVAAYAAGDATGPDLAAATELVAACTECAELHRDLRAIATALPELPVPARTRDFRLTPEQAASLEPSGWRGVLAAFASPRFRLAAPLGTGLAAAGLAGLLLATPGGLIPASSGTSGAPTGADGGAPVGLPAPEGAFLTGASEAPSAAAAAARPPPTPRRPRPPPHPRPPASAAASENSVAIVPNPDPAAASAAVTTGGSRNSTTDGAHHPRRATRRASSRSRAPTTPSRRPRRPPRSRPRPTTAAGHPRRRPPRGRRPPGRAPRWGPASSPDRSAGACRSPDRPLAPPREPDPERRPVARDAVALDLDRAAVRRRQVAHDGQAQPAAARVRSPVEAVEHASSSSAGMPSPVVGHGQDGIGPDDATSTDTRPPASVWRTALATRLTRISRTRTGSTSASTTGSPRSAELDATCLGDGPLPGEGLAAEADEVHRLAVERQRPGLGEGDRAQVVEEAVHDVGLREDRARCGPRPSGARRRASPPGRRRSPSAASAARG